MARLPSLPRTLSSTIPFARGVADRAVRTAGPVVVGVVGRVTTHLPRRPRTEPSRPQTFVPSSLAEKPVAAAELVLQPESGNARATSPSPAVVARNVAGPRPSARLPERPTPRSVPGAKLPVTRLRDTTDGSVVGVVRRRA